MGSIILDLQSEITSSDCDIVNALRKAQIIASKLDLKDFSQWISNELNGYSDCNNIPRYRWLRGDMKARDPYHGWIPTMIATNEVENQLCEHKIPNSISEIVSLCQSGTGIIMTYSGSVQSIINKEVRSPINMQYALHISNAAAKDIIEKVKNTVLEWTLRLELGGILGEGMKFNEKEKSIARGLPQEVNYYNYGTTTVINGSTENLQVVSGNDNTVTFTYEKAKLAVDEIREAVQKENITDEAKETAIEILSDIDGKIKNNKKINVIKALLEALRDFLINASSSLAASLVQAKIQGLF